MHKCILAVLQVQRGASLMNTASHAAAAPWSLTAYRQYNDALETKYGPSLTATKKLHAQAREHLARARRAGHRTSRAIEELEAAMASILDVLERDGRAR